MADIPVPEFHCPIVCLPGIADVWGGSYDFPDTKAEGNPTILDIGSNCGAFALRSLLFFPGATIHAYEPNPEIFPFLQRNCSPRVICHNEAVGDTEKPSLYRGADTPLCGSQYPNQETTVETIPIKVIQPELLPVADIVKIDTEGAEGFIVERLQFIPRLLALEWHGDENRQRVEKALAGKMRLLSTRLICPGLGILKYCYL